MDERARGRYGDLTWGAGREEREGDGCCAERSKIWWQNRDRVR